MNIWAVVPAKPLVLAKSRLGKALKPEHRAALAKRMLEHTLEVLAGWDALAGVLLVSSDAEICRMGENYQASILREADVPGLNTSLERARVEVLRRGGSALLVAAGDLPLLDRPSLAKMLAGGDASPLVAIAPDHSKKGTNALLLAPPAVIPFHFGPDSFSLHRRAAQAAGAALIQVDAPQLAYDVDLPGDLKRREFSWFMMDL